jgi:hypothetical protein
MGVGRVVMAMRVPCAAIHDRGGSRRRRADRGDAIARCIIAGPCRS